MLAGMPALPGFQKFQLFPLTVHRLILFDEVFVWGVCAFELWVWQPVDLALRVDNFEPGR